MYSCSNCYAQRTCIVFHKKNKTISIVLVKEDKND